MKTLPSFLLYSSSSRWLWLLALAFAVIGGSRLELSGEEPPAVTTSLVPGSFRLIQRKVYQDGARRIVYDRITPPQIIPPVVAPAPVLSPEEQEARAAKMHGVLSLGATVYDHEVTEIHWTGAQGRRHVVYSNVDFSLVAGLGQFETSTAVYTLTLGWGQATRESLTADAAAALPAKSAFPADYAVYFVSPEDVFTEEDEAVLSGLDALHEYYDAHRAELAAAYQQRLAQLAAHEAQMEWERAHPSPPKDKVLKIWKKSPATGGEGGQP